MNTDRFLARARMKNLNEEIIGYYCNGSIVRDACFYNIDLDTLCQCTGLKDKNGKLIFEGDIVVWTSQVIEDDIIDFDEPKYTEEVFFVKYLDGLFQLDFDGGMPIAFIDRENVGIIGNIFDNPELLEEKT